MGKIWLVSDTHFGHQREFIYGPRGFDSIWEHDKQIIKNWNKLISWDDEVYHLGDVMLGDNSYGLSCLKQLSGQIHIIRGNHDTDARLELYKDCWNVVEICEGKFLKYNGQSFYLNHFPTLTSNLEKEPNIKSHIINLFGHTHQKSKFYQDIPYMYCVGLDAHECKPICIDDIIEDIKKEIKNCVKYL